MKRVLSVGGAHHSTTWKRDRLVFLRMEDSFP